MTATDPVAVPGLAGPPGPAGPARPPGLAKLAGAADLSRRKTDRELAGMLSIADKVDLLTGADSWRTQGSEAIGLRQMVTSDGPAGVRGVTKDERHPSACLPCPSALGATWDAEVVYRLAAALGAEARAKGVDVLLAPTVNMMRTPLGGRGFECFAEDPVLTATLASAYVRGVQSAGVAATVKHYVGNDSETGRRIVDARIAESVLRELYLAPFEACVREAGAWLVMAAYNKVNGHRMTENVRLLRDVLKNEWGFDGVVTSDWDAALSTEETAAATLDLSMPGPSGPWGDLLAHAIADGSVSLQLLDDKIIRLLRLARRVGALADPAGAGTVTDPAVHHLDAKPARAGGQAAAPGMQHHPGPSALVDPDVLRTAAAESFVLLRNAGNVLPLDPAALGSIAVIGPNAVHPTIQGGGSAGVIPASVSDPVHALRGALSGQAEVITATGCQNWQLLPEPEAGSLTDPETGEPGVRLEFTDAGGTVIAAEHRSSSSLAWWDAQPDGIGWGEPGRIVLTATFRPGSSGAYILGAAGVGHLTLAVDGTTVIDDATPVPADAVEAMTRPGELRATVRLEEGANASLRLEFSPAADGEGPLAVRFGAVPAIDDDHLLEQAEAAAATAGAAIVVVGSAELTESEGFDRSTLALPGRQDELVSRVAAVNSRTVVVINSGMPVLMPWAGQVQAIIYAWLPGEAFGAALSDVLLGAAEPGGRLPVTMPAAEEDCPVLHAVPDADGLLRYDEGLLIGYRGYDANGTAPLFPFGHGLGFTTWEYQALACPAAVADGTDLEVTVMVRNTGSRPGKEVVQAYLAEPGDPAGKGRPVRALAGFAAVRAAPGEAVQVRVHIPARAFARYDEDLASWIWPGGEFTVEVGSSSRALPLSAPVRSGIPGQPGTPQPRPASATAVGSRQVSRRAAGSAR